MSLSKTLYPLLRYGSTQKTFRYDQNTVDWDVMRQCISTNKYVLAIILKLKGFILTDFVKQALTLVDLCHEIEHLKKKRIIG